jgi:hypothetical protein
MNSTLVKQYNSLRFRLSDLSNMSGLMNIPNDVWGNLEKGCGSTCKVLLESANPHLDDETIRSFFRRLDSALDDIREYRKSIQHRNVVSFSQKKDSVVVKARTTLANRIFPYEGFKYDFSIKVGFGLPLSVQITNKKTTRFRSKNIVTRSVSLNCSPSTVNQVNDQWSRFIVKGEVQFVIGAEVIPDHAFNERRIEVYRLTCFGTERNYHDEPTVYSHYLVEHETGVFAHGKDPNVALSLLNRRLKAEVLKRLQD